MIPIYLTWWPSWFPCMFQINGGSNLSKVEIFPPSAHIKNERVNFVVCFNPSHASLPVKKHVQVLITLVYSLRDNWWPQISLANSIIDIYNNNNVHTWHPIFSYNYTKNCVAVNFLRVRSKLNSCFSFHPFRERIPHRLSVFIERDWLATLEKPKPPQNFLFHFPFASSTKTRW